MLYIFELGEKNNKKIITEEYINKILLEYSTNSLEEAKLNIEIIINRLKNIIPKGKNYNLDLIYDNIKDNECPLYLVERITFKI